MHRISLRMRELRQEKDMSQAELGRILNVRKACISIWESGVIPSPDR